MWIFILFITTIDCKTIPKQCLYRSRFTEEHHMNPLEIAHKKKKKRKNPNSSEWNIPRKPQLWPPYQETQLKKQNNRLNT